MKSPLSAKNKIHPHGALTNLKKQPVYVANQKKGLWAEDFVVRELDLQGWGLAARRKKLINGEVDLILRREHEIIFIEVKYLNDAWNTFERITKEQKRKLIANRVYYSLRFPQFEFNAAIAFVTRAPTSTLNLIRLEE